MLPAVRRTGESGVEQEIWGLIQTEMSAACPPCPPPPGCRQGVGMEDVQCKRRILLDDRKKFKIAMAAKIYRRHLRFSTRRKVCRLISLACATSSRQLLYNAAEPYQADCNAIRVRPEVMSHQKLKIPGRAELLRQAGPAGKLWRCLAATCGGVPGGLQPTLAHLLNTHNY